MASYNFCPSCGSKTPNTGITVKFCANCGYNFITATAFTQPVQTPPPQKQSAPVFINSKPKNKFNRYTSTDVSDDEDDDVMFKDGLPELKASDFVVEDTGNGNRFRAIKDLGAPEGLGPRNLPRVSVKQFKEQWKTDAGCANAKPIEVGE